MALAPHPQFVPYKCLALVVFYGLAFPHFFIERRDLEARTLFEKGGEGDGGSILWSFYKTAVSFILYLPYYIYAVFVVVPLTHLLW